MIRALDEVGLLFSASKDPDAKMTFVGAVPGAVAVKLPTTAAAERAVEAEGRVLVGLRRLALGALDSTIPRYVGTPLADGRRGLLSTALPGAAMTVAYHQWGHTARRRPVDRDLALAAGWLAAFQAATARGHEPVRWPMETVEALARRWDGDQRLAEALARLAGPTERLCEARTPSTAVHGDYWMGNVLVENHTVTGVVDWEAGALAGCPLRDLARFPLSYALYLDRHAHPGGTVTGHPGLRRHDFGAGVRYALLGAGWLPDAVRAFLGDGLVRLGLRRDLWYAVALTGIAEIAATANDDAFGSGHLDLLVSLPERPRGHRRSR